jgi:hypothetical protein
VILPQFAVGRLGVAWFTLLVACSGQPAAPGATGSGPGVIDDHAEPLGGPLVPLTSLPEVQPVAAGEPRPSPVASPAPELDDARAALEAVVRDHARDPENPWAITHAILALGPSVELTNGEDAVAWVFKTYAEKEGAELRFPKRRGEVRVEPHTDLVLKNLSELGLKPSHAVTVGGAASDLATLWRSRLARTWANGEKISAISYNDLPWTLQGLAAWAPPGLSWTAEGRQTSLDTLTVAAARQLAKDTAFMRDAIAAGRTVEKRKQGIFGYACGGAHMIQGVGHAVGKGFGGAEAKRLFDAEIPVLFWRLDYELGLVDGLLTQHPKYALQLRSQRLKFLGHFLETTHKLAAAGVFAPDEAQRAAMGRARVELGATVRALVTDGAFGRLPAIRSESEQLYLDLVGDSAHALRGLDLSTGRASYRL